MMVPPTAWLRRKLPESGEKWLRENAGGVGAAAIAIFAVFATGAAGRAVVDVETAAPTSGSIVIVGHQVPTGDAWTERLSDPSAWRGGRYIGDRRGSRSTRPGEPADIPERDQDRPPERAEFNASSYRTVCVRLCDGYFFPISFATKPEHFTHDAAACRSRCGSPAKLYVYPNPGGEPEQMVDVDGKPYSALKSAFLFRTSYDAACTCKAPPWSQEALARHRTYADAQKKSRTRTVARATRPEQPRQASAASDTAGSGTRPRPEGAMLLGSDQPASPPRASKKAEQQRSRANGSGGSSGRRNDWEHRAFTGN